MDESYGINWVDDTAEVQTEEVICEEIPLEEDGHYEVTEEVVETEPTENLPIMYLPQGNILVVQTGSEPTFQDPFMECSVTEEIVTEQWSENCQEEIVVGSEEAVISEDIPIEESEIPLPTDQDEYAAARPYPCDFCSRRFRKKANLMNHMVAHKTDRPHGCNLCGVRYIRKCDLLNHLKVHAFIPDGEAALEDEDDDDGRVRKVRRRRKFKIKEEYDEEEEEGAGSSSKSYNYVDEDMRLMEAMENNVKSDYGVYIEDDSGKYPVTDPNKPFVCQHCGVGFAREKALASHSKVHAGDSPFECQKCNEMFWNLPSLREHLRDKHGEEIDEFGDEEEEDDDEYSDTESKYGTFYCPTCGLSFHRQDNLRRHQRVHVKEEFVAAEPDLGHICNVCGESFQEALDLLAHAEIHARGSEHRCMICGEVCPDDSAVADHVQTKHGKALPANSCLLCGRTCKDKRTLLKHSWEHNKEKMFSCSKCAKMFHNKARLKRHMLSHRNKVVTCDVCGEEFPDGRSLMNHRHSHSSVSGRQFPCRECGKTFGSRSSQQIHIRIHTGERPYGCRFCWKAFADGGTLRKHERIHTGEKPYACAVCPRAFNQRVVLREHIRSHHSGPDPKYSHSVTPYCCSVCSDMFATSQDLIVHLIHHCDMNTAMKRLPQVGPRKYKRRRKLKPHELEMISGRVEINRHEEEEDEDHFTDETEEDEDKFEEKVKKKVPSSSPSQKAALTDSYSDLYNNSSGLVDTMGNTIATPKTPPKSKKIKAVKSESSPVMPSRPKMIHTQKTRVPMEMGEDGKVRHKTRTMVTRTHPTELKSATGERIRPRTKNVSYHILHEKLPLATFPEDTDQAVTNMLRQENPDAVPEPINGAIFPDNPLETAEPEAPAVPVTLVKVRSNKPAPKRLKPGKHIIGPQGKLVRLVGQGMIVSKIKNKGVEQEPESILPEHDAPTVGRRTRSSDPKQFDPSALHELAEISMQHAQMFKCEMCSEVFTDRAQLLVHVPIHI